MPTIVLFDIDGTLITTGGASRQALTDAFARRYGRDDLFDGFAFGGRTDRGIIRHGLVRAGAVEPAMPPDAIDAIIDGMIEHYLPVLADTLDHAETHRLHPGVLDLIAALEARGASFALGLGTGNVERSARIKLRPFDINPRLPFGGFGCDAEDRAALIAAGFARAAARLGVSVDRCHRVVIGDTPRDVEAAHANGARAIAVATGGVSRAELDAAAPDALFDDLTDHGALEAILAR